MTHDVRRPALHVPTTRFLLPALLLAVLLSGLPTWAVAGSPQSGEDAATVLSDSQIVEALHPGTTRGFAPRGLTRHGTAEAVQSVNLNVPFEHNSSALRPQASAQLKQLELALTSAALRDDRFVVAGHTDAKGSPRYNKQLSLRRAEAVKRFLVAGGVAAARLDAVGFGSEKLLAPDQPEDPRNRRVEIRDIGRPSP
jgi:outer membrane protein OmpA-like peptidoglycan-associated protein